MSKSCAHILLTSAGGAFIYDYVRGLRSDPELRVRVIGTDLRADPDSAALLDGFYQVPRADDPSAAFGERVLEICRREKIDVIIPGSDREALALAQLSDQLRELSVVTSVVDPEPVSLSNNKRALYAKLRAANVDLGQYVPIDSAADFREGLHALGYPAKRAVLKPSVGAGSRGIFIIDAAVAGFDLQDSKRFNGRSNAASFLGAVDGDTFLNGYILMEYVDNPFFDVDVLVHGGSLAIVVPRMRHYDQGMYTVSIGHRLTFRDDVIALASRTAEVVGFAHCGDMDIGTRADGALTILDVSCRFSGSVNATVDAGLSLPLQLVRSLLGLPLARLELTDGTRCIPFNHMVTVSPADGRRVTIPLVR